MRTLCLLLALAVSPAFGQPAVDIATEPHHRLLLSNDQVRVFAVELKPTEQAFVQHDHSFLTVALQDGEIVMWSGQQSPIQSFHVTQGDVRFSMGGLAAGLRNDRTVDYRNITVEFLNPKVTSYSYQLDTGTWGYGSGGINPPVDPHAKYVSRMSLQAASVEEVQLLAGDGFPAPEKEAAELLIPVTEIDLKQGDRHIRKSPGEIVPLASGRKYDLLNANADPIRFVDVELLAEPPK